ncbi:MAG: TetR/AcrR family transcriptional regulator, partial [Acidimicrobiaceae bacterium]|nr:TetR/AcrR family transcriptional regulator [Acidimicrobiaceae bacterium]
MPRVSVKDRLLALASAATEEFGASGYRATRTADVARRAGVSNGTLFTYVESKEALFHLVFVVGFADVDDVLSELPMPTPGPGETLELIAQGLRRQEVARFRLALKEDAPTDVREELQAIVEERYDMFDRLWPLLTVIERCAADLPELEAFYFSSARLRYFHQLTRYLERRVASGHLRPMPDA